MPVHDKLSRVRKPRVHITYEVETDGASVQRELPFVMGVLGDFSGNPTTPLKPLRDRKFVNIDRDNFDEVMAKFAPELNMRVENTIQGDESEMAVHLEFRSLDDFSPARVVDQVEPLKKLRETRDRISDLMTRIDRSDELEEALEDGLKELKKMRDKEKKAKGGK